MTNAIASPNRRALLVGINRYPRLSPDFQLGGCINDIEAMAATLTDRFGFPPEQIVRLTDESATQQGIRRALAALVAAVEEGDVVVIHYSGHGSQMRDREGDSPTGMDETIVPSDSGRDPDPNRDIHDREIHHWLLRLAQRTPFVTLIFDCCHSGHISRRMEDSFSAPARWLQPDLRPLDELPPLPPELELSPLSAMRGRDLGASAWRLPLSDRYVLIAGCRSDESSYEILAAPEQGQPRHGALTFHLCQELANVRPGATYRDVFEVVASRVTARYGRQHPQLEGVRNRQIFGLTDVTPLRYVQVVAVEEGRLALGAGAACDIRRGSTWSIYPAGTATLAGGVCPLGWVEVTKAGASRSEAKVREGGGITPGCRAVERTHRFGELRFGVEIAVPPGREREAEPLRRRISRSEILELVGAAGSAGGKPEREADVRIHLIPARRQAREGDALPELGALPADSWVVVGGDDHLKMSVHRISEPGVEEVLGEDLERLARYRFAMELADPGGPLAGKIKLSTLRRSGGGWQEEGADSGPANGELVFHDGDSIAFRISHRHDKPLYFYLLDFGLSGAISLVDPAAGGEQKPLVAGEIREVGIAEEERIELFIPECFPFDGKESSLAAGGVETLKLFASTREMDLEVLFQKGVRGVDLRKEDAAGESPLRRLLRQTLVGSGTRETRRQEVPEDDQWTVTQYSFRLVPS
jgi:hypothetical protein